MRSITQIAAILHLCVLVFFLVACGATGNVALPPTQTATQPPVEDTPVTQQFPTGSFKAVNPVYAEEIRFFEDGNYAVRFTGELTWENAYWGTYAVTNDQLVFDDPETECAGHPGTYLWSFDGTTLTLKVVEDTCTALPRARDLGHAWTKLP